MSAQRGFTLTELVIVLIITGVLAAVAVPRLFDKNQFAARGAHDFVVSSVRYAQKTAIAMRRVTCISSPAGGTVLTVQYANTLNVCQTSQPVINPSSGLAFSDASNALPEGMTVVSALNLKFDPSGRPVTQVGGVLTPVSTVTSISVSGYGQPITVEPETGLVR